MTKRGGKQSKVAQNFKEKKVSEGDMASKKRMEVPIGKIGGSLKKVYISYNMLNAPV